jgi:alkylhydroperoxidase/carboxymuconolactone decarboxylase family protein YurZ
MSLDESDRRLVRLFTAGVLGRFDAVLAVRREARAGEPDRRWREAVLQVHVFAGFPRSVELYGVLDSAGGLGELEPGEFSALEPGKFSELEPEELAAFEPGKLEAGDESRGSASQDATVRENGRALFERIYREDAPAVRAMLERHHPDFARWIEQHAYGRVLARPGLSPDRRELLAVAALSALGQERQLASHARGALRCGATRAEIDEVLDCAADLIEPERLVKARRVVERFV